MAASGVWKMFALRSKNSIGILCIFAAVYFIALPLTITTNSSGDSFLKLLTLPLGAIFAAALVFYKEKLEFNSIHLFYLLYVFKMICINDTPERIDYEKVRREVIAAYENKLPQKSGFEV